ncbi:MAG: protein kinase domain-containing protein [Aridibacter sp.]
MKTPEHWQKVKDIFDDTLKIKPESRESFLKSACAEDEELRLEVKSLLASYDDAENFMENPAIGEVAESFVGTKENSLQIAEFLNHYRIITNLGAGGMGEVYLAEDTKLNRFVALKLLPQSKSADKDANRRLLREAQSAAVLDHPHICQIHEIAETDGRSFIVMQFCEGETLAEKLEKGKLELRETLDLAIQIADALANAHSHHIIHRDIKPANIVVNQHGQAKILDFNLAKIVAEKRKVESEGDTAKILSADNPIIGTAPYMSPEQMRGKLLDVRTDIFSFGALLYEMLTGEQVFKHESQAETIAAVLHFEPPVAKMLADTPLELQRIVQKSLAKNKEERYQTAKDLVLDLQNVRQELDFQDKLERTAEPHSEAKTEILDVAEITDKRPIAEITTSRSKNRRLGFIIGAIVLLFAVVGFGYWFFSTKQIESIAVMPFINESGNEEIEYLSDGMTESLINSLSQLPHLSVKARSSVFRYKNKDTTAQQIGSDLDVQAVLNGRVTEREGILTLSLELIEAHTGNLIWGERYERKLTDLVVLQNEIAHDVSNKLKTKLSGAEKNSLAKNYTENTEAYRLYLQGRFYWNKRTGKDLFKSIEYFEQAIALDPNYALAYAGLADSYALLSPYLAASPAESMPEARDAALKALALDDQLVEAHTALGLILNTYDYDFAGAEREFRRAIELNPNYATAHQFYGELLTYLGRHEESEAEFRLALEIDPFSRIINRQYGESLIYARKYEASVVQLRKTLDLDPNFASTHASLSFIYQTIGKYQDAIEEYAKFQELIGEDRNAAIIRQSFAEGNFEGFLRTMTGANRPSNAASYSVATWYAILGEKDKAFDELNKAFENREYSIVLLKVDPRFDEIRSDTRFSALLRRVGFPQ